MTQINIWTDEREENGDEISKRVVAIFRDFPDFISWVKYHWRISIFLHDDEQWCESYSQFVDWDKYAKIALKDPNYGFIPNSDGSVTVLRVNPK